MKNRLLLRQLKLLKLTEENPPASPKEWQEFLTRIERAYNDADQERYLLERSLRISSEEMLERSKIIEQERARTAQAGKMAALGEMAAGIAHEINNPLAMIQMRSGLLRELVAKENGEDKTITDALTKIEKNVDRIAKIISGLRTFSRDGSRDPIVNVSLSSIIEETLVFCAARFRQNEVEFQFQPIDSQFEIECRATQISQVILNLLNNSYDAIHKQTKKWIKLEVLIFPETVEISVTDCGPGIPESVQQKLFQPFFTTKEVGKGTGLGLSLSKGILEQHHGTLRIDSSSSNTKFIISLPIRQPLKKSA